MVKTQSAIDSFESIGCKFKFGEAGKWMGWMGSASYQTKKVFDIHIWQTDLQLLPETTKSPLWDNYMWRFKCTYFKAPESQVLQLEQAHCNFKTCSQLKGFDIHIWQTIFRWCKKTTKYLGTIRCDFSNGHVHDTLSATMVCTWQAFLCLIFCLQPIFCKIQCIVYEWVDFMQKIMQLFTAGNTPCIMLMGGGMNTSEMERGSF